MISDSLRKLIYLFRIDFNYLFKTKLKFSEKLSYNFVKYLCVMFNKRKIKYLGSYFYYDNRYSPFLLQTYPGEIQKLNQHVPLTQITTILDVGANIGQFSNSINKLYSNIQIYSFEPNKEIFNYLKKNCSKEKVQIFNFGLAEKTTKKNFFYAPSASAEGSLFPENMNQNYERKDVKEIKVDLKSLSNKILKKYHIPKKIDLVKIDVEGAEIDALKALRQIEFDFLLIEVSTRKRKGSDLETIKKTIKKIWGKKAIVLYYDLPEKNSPAANVLIKII